MHYLDATYEGIKAQAEIINSIIFVKYTCTKKIKKYECCFTIKR